MLEKRVLEIIDAWISEQSLFNILGKIGSLAVVIAVLTFIEGEGERRDNDVYIAWQTITSAYKQKGNGGRKEALHVLNYRPLRFPWIVFTETWTGQTEIDWFWNKQNNICKPKRLFGRRWKRQPLDGLEAPGAHLLGVILCGASLTNADFEEANLWYANFQGAKLNGTNFQEAGLVNANFQDSKIVGVNLQGANLVGANFQDANLAGANLAGAFLLQQVSHIQGKDIERTNIIPKEIKLACFWEQAIYKAKWNEKKKTFTAEPNNKIYIEKLKKDKSSNPKEPIDCSKWKT